MQPKIFEFLKRPNLYDPGTTSYWDNDHIAEGMLEKHQDPLSDVGTRNNFQVQQSARWIATSFHSKEYPQLLDLGCGAGICTELYAQSGYRVTGIDISRRSIRYATSHSKRQGLSINYQHMDYLNLNFRDRFDIVTMTGYEYSTLSPRNRNMLLKKIHSALKPGGILLIDAYSEKAFADKKERDDFQYFPDGGFWYPKEHIYLHATFIFDNRTSVQQNVVVAKGNPVLYFNLWEHDFKEQELKAEFQNPGFTNLQFFGDAAGNDYNFQSKTICVFAQK